MSDASEPLRALARERGRILGELGMRAEDERWARREAEAIAGLVEPALRLRLPRLVHRLMGRIRRAS